MAKQIPPTAISHLGEFVQRTCTCTCSFNMHFAITKTHAWLMNCQQPVVKLVVRMSSATERFIDPTLTGTIQQCLFICPFHNDIISFILRKRMGEVIMHTVTVTDTPTTHAVQQLLPITPTTTCLYTQPHFITPSLPH